MRAPDGLFDILPHGLISFSGPNLNDIQTFFISNLCWLAYNKFLYFVGTYLELLCHTLFNTPQVRKRNTLADYLSKPVC